MGWIKLDNGLDYTTDMVNTVPSGVYGAYLICEHLRMNPNSNLIERFPLKYIGRTKKPRLQERLQEHLDGKDKVSNKLLYDFMMDGGITKVFYYWITKDEDEAKGREASLLRKYHKKPGYDLFNQQSAGDNVDEIDTELPTLVKYIGNWITNVKK